MKNNNINKNQKAVFVHEIVEQGVPEKFRVINTKAEKAFWAFHKAIITNKEEKLLNDYLKASQRGNRHGYTSLGFQSLGSESEVSCRLNIELSKPCNAFMYYSGLSENKMRKLIQERNKPQAAKHLDTLRELAIERKEIVTKKDENSRDLFGILNPIRTISSLEKQWPEIVEVFKIKSGWADSQISYPIMAINTTELTELIREASK